MKHNTPLLWLPMKASVCFVCTCVRVYTRACASVFGYVSLLKCAYFSGATFMCRLMCLSVSHTIWLLGNHCFPIRGQSIRAGMKSKGTQQSKQTSVLFLWTTNNVKMFWSICPTTSVWEQKTEIQTLTASHLGQKYFWIPLYITHNGSLHSITRKSIKSLISDNKVCFHIFLYSGMYTIGIHC